MVQDTGFSEFLPTGSGLLAFSNEQEARDAVMEVESNYIFHKRRARDFASEHLDSDKVLNTLLKSVGLS